MESQRFSFKELRELVELELSRREKYARYWDTFPGLGVPNSSEDVLTKIKYAVKDVRLSFKPNPYLAMIDRSDETPENK